MGLRGSTILPRHRPNLPAAFSTHRYAGRLPQASLLESSDNPSYRRTWSQACCRKKPEGRVWKVCDMQEPTFQGRRSRLTQGPRQGLQSSWLWGVGDRGDASAGRAQTFSQTLSHPEEGGRVYDDLFCFFLKGEGSFSDDRATLSGPFPSPSKPAQVSAWCQLPEEDRVLTLTHLSSARCVPRSPGL